jgi:succinate dehydrogenase cytochrome b556 subunit
MVLGVSFLLIFVKAINYYSSNYAFYSLGFFFLDYLYFGLALCIVLILSFHIANGIRHLIWDFGVAGFTIKEVSLSHKLVILLCIVLFLRFVGLTIFSL